MGQSNPQPVADRSANGATLHELQGEYGSTAMLLESYRNYLRLLAGLSIRRELQSKLDASDVAQETIILAHRRFGDFRGTTEGELIAWLRRILASRLVDLGERRFGAQQRDVRLERRLQGDLERSSDCLDGMLADSGESPSQSAARRERAVLLADVLAELSPPHRAILVLRHLDGLSFEAAAGEMGRSVDAVKKLWARALVQARRAASHLA